MDARVDAQLNLLQSFIQAPPIQQITFTPGGTTSTPASGTATWVTIGSFTVPVWATQVWVIYTINQFFDNGTTANVVITAKLGGVAGIGKRLITPGVTGQRLNEVICDHFTSVPTGSQTLLLSATFTAGTTLAVDTQSLFTAMAFFSA